MRTIAYTSIVVLLAMPTAEPATAQPPAAHSTAAQPAPELVTDRPDQTESSALVPPGWVQIETGAVYEKAGDATTISIGTTLLRVGLLDNLELRITGEYAHERMGSDDAAPERNGLAGVSAGVKIGVAKEDEVLPQIAFIGHLSLPVGSEFFRPDVVAPDFRFALSKSLGESFGIAANVGAEWDGASASGAGLYTLTVALDASDRIGVYAEVFGTVYGDAPPVHMVDAGVTFLPADNVQLDASFGLAASPAAPEHYGSVGVSVRAPR